ncbi:MAG TPA: DUF2325 domain-containing protein [Chromatiales bacterium]|nr:DUF2325 domain-containing protein [Thiotrichales bacterium]HIP67798.1 DUF2325 domain-containing protein [Chromatiales bacterium]
MVANINENDYYLFMCEKHLQNTIAASLGIDTTPPFLPDNLDKLPKKITRKKLWELDHHLHCGVIGTCLTLKELRSIAHKCKLSEIYSASDYDLHHWFVIASTQASAVSKMLNKKLESKFARDIRLINKKNTAAELISFWKKAKTSGDVAGPYWALITHPATSEELLNLIYGDIHMLSHLAGASCRIEQQTLKQTQAQNIELHQALNQSRKKTMGLQSEKETALRKLEDERKAHAHTQKRLTASQSQLQELVQKTETTSLQNLIDTLSAQLSRANLENKQAQKTATDNKKTIRQLERQVQRLNSRLEKQMENWWPQPSDTSEKTCPISGENNEAGCPHPDLCGRKILYVGGRVTSCPHLKSAAETVNGCFLYHDGGLEENPHKLTAALQQADAVFFPTDCISHEATIRVKDFCSRAKKPLVQLKSSGISSFKESLHQFAQQQFPGEAS